LIRCRTGITQNDLDLLKRHVKFFGHNLSKCGLDSGSKINVAVQSYDSAIFPKREQKFDAFGRVAWHCCRLTWRGWISGRRVTHHQQYASRV
jgi:hypothetical protein